MMETVYFMKDRPLSEARDQKIRMDEFSSNTVWLTTQFWENLNRYSWFFNGWVFQVNVLAHDPEIEISVKSWMSFPGFDNKG